MEVTKQSADELTHVSTENLPLWGLEEMLKQI